MRPLLVALGLQALAAASPPTDLIYGHHEIHVDYQSSPSDPDAGWSFSVSYDTDNDFTTNSGIVRLDPADTVFVASPATEKTVPNPPGFLSRFGPAGSKYWLLPFSPQLGTPYLGVRTTVPPGIFRQRVGDNYSPSPTGTISLRLISVEGPGAEAGGVFAAWRSDAMGAPIFAFDSSDGIGTGDEIPTIQVSSHTHYNWGFNRPGLYRVTLEAFGRLNSNNAFTSGRATLLFSIPFSSRLGDGDQLRLWATSQNGGPPVPTAAVADPQAAVFYDSQQTIWEVTRAATSAAAGLPGALWETNGTIARSGSAFSSGVGVDPQAVAAGLPDPSWSGVTWQLSDVEGPGHLAVLGSGGGLLASSHDGLNGQDAFSVPSTPLDIVFAFTSPGLYRARFRAAGTMNGQATLGPERILVFGVNLAGGFTYSQWADSFERSGGLPVGALADRDGDADRDGLPNATEFAFFFQGLSPVRPDRALMPRPRPTPEGYAAVEFLRDTWIDPLDETGWEIRPAASPDLQVWQIRSSRVSGEPLDVFETGAGPGNAHGRVVQRQLRVMPAPKDRHFFRFHVTPKP